MKSKAEIRREIEKVSSEYSAYDLFSSRYFAEMLQATITAVCEKLGRIPDIATVCDEESDMTACTNGLHILVNTQAPFVSSLDTNWKQYIANIGLTVHECGHVLFTDFANQNPMLTGWITGKFEFYPETPNITGAKELKKLMNEYPNLRKVYVSAMRGIVNAIEDAYIENRLRENFDGLAVAGLELDNQTMFEQASSLNEMLDNCIAGDLLPIHVAHNIILMRYKVGRDVRVEEPLEGMKLMLYSAIEGVIAPCDALIKKLSWEQNGVKRCEMFNELFVRLFQLMPPLPKDDMGEGTQDGDSESEGEKATAENESGKGKSGDETSRDYSDSETEGMMSSGMAEEQQSGQSQEPVGDTSGIRQSDSKEKQDEANAKAENGRRLSSSTESMERELKKALKEAVTNKVLEVDEMQHVADLRKEVAIIKHEIEKIMGGSRLKDYSLTRSKTGNKEVYSEVFKEVRKTSRNLTRKIENILKERECESVDSGFLMGQRFNAKDVVNRDGKYFSRQVIPDGKAEVAFGVLIDESGSMSARDKYITARKAAITIEDTLKNLGIPNLIVGHTEKSWGTCELKVYSDFATNDGKDSYRLADIGAGGGNIDGAAVTYIGEKLLKRPEKIKVMIVISDGLPAGSSFYADNANEDTKLAVSNYRKKNINVFGAVVDQFEQVAEIYGKDYVFDCRSDGALEKELVKIIKKFVLLR